MTKWELPQENKVGLTSKNQLILYSRLIELKDKKKKHMIISAAIGKTFGKIQHPFMIKTQANKKKFPQSRQNPELLKPDKEFLKNPTTVLYLMVKD